MAQDTTLTEDDIKKLAQRGGMDLGDQQNFWEFFDAAQTLVNEGGGGDPGASISAQVAAAETEVQVVALTIPANTLAAGDSFAIEAYATQAGTNAATPTFRVRIGPTTLTGNIAATLTGTNGNGVFASRVSGLVTIRSIGASGSALGSLTHAKQDGAGYDFITRNVLSATVAVDTTVENVVEFTAVSGNAAVIYNFQVALIKQA